MKELLGRGWDECARHALRRVAFPLAPPETYEFEVLARMLKCSIEELIQARIDDEVPDFWTPIAQQQQAEENR